jgi:hypothetical protein
VSIISSEMGDQDMVCTEKVADSRYTMIAVQCIFGEMGDQDIVCLAEVADSPYAIVAVHIE